MLAATKGRESGRNNLRKGEAGLRPREKGEKPGQIIIFKGHLFFKVKWRV